MAIPLIEDFTIDDRGFLFIIESSHSKHFRMEFHRHDFFELSFVLGGKGQYEILGADGETRKVPVEANQILLWDGSIPTEPWMRRSRPSSSLSLFSTKATW
jgi:cupin superfamily acireductone dioxygenase involved in methionine salvage